MLLESEIREFAQIIIEHSFNGFCKLDGIVFRCRDKNTNNVTMLYNDNEAGLIELLDLVFGDTVYYEMYSILENIINSRLTYIEE